MTQKRDRRAEIVEKSRDIFLRYGYRKTTVADIGRACGLGKAALYHYFPGKEAIFAAVVEEESLKLLVHIRSAVSAAEGPRAKFKALFITRFRRITELMSEVRGYVPDLLPQANAARARFFDEEAKLLAEILDEGRREGVFRRVEASSIALIIAGIRGVEAEFAARYSYANGDAGPPNPETLTAAIETVTDLFLDGVCAS